MIKIVYLLITLNFDILTITHFFNHTRIKLFYYKLNFQL
jgi:hypothetical protein